MTNGDRSVDPLNVALFDEDFHGFEAEHLHFRLLKRLTPLQLLYLPVQVWRWWHLSLLLLLALKVIIYSSLMLKLQVRNILCGLYVFLMLFLFVRSVLATLQQFKKCFSEFNLWLQQKCGWSLSHGLGGHAYIVFELTF